MVLERRLDKIRDVVSKRQAGFAIVIEDVHDPHNAEAIFRTCDAFGVQEVYLIFDKQKPWNPTKLGKQSSSSANKWLNFHVFRSAKECFSDLKKKGYLIVGTSLDKNSESIFNFSLDNSDVALVIGNEHNGLSDEAIRLADLLLHVPMQGMVESLNVSVAAAIFIYELTRQRVSSGKVKGLSSESKNRLIEEFSAKSSKRMKRN